MDVSRILDLLASQIYDTPYALLRENVQNAYDAILMRQSSTQSNFEPRITVTISESEVKVEDNGIGMSEDTLAKNFWTAGSSGKNTPEARAAGVVGTFGIGGLANFGICKKLTIVTEMAQGKRIRSSADRDTLSLEKDCISLESLPPTGEPGTSVLAQLPQGKTINVAEATIYLLDFVRHLQVPVILNGTMVSKKPFEESVPPEPKTWGVAKLGCGEGQRLSCDVDIRMSESATIWLHLRNIVLSGSPLVGEIVLRQGAGQIMAFRNTFGLARTGVSSNYLFGGVANLNLLQPTAGRDALTTESIQILQTIVSELEQLIGPLIAESPLIDLNTPFLNWIARYGRYELCGNLKARVLPGDMRVPLKEIAEQSKKIPINAYRGFDEAIMKTLASEGSPLIQIARANPRAQCETQYLSQMGNVSFVTDEPKILTIAPDRSWSIAQAGLALRLALILETDYFIKTKIQFGTISHNLPFLVKDDGQPITITLSPAHHSLSALLQCYDTDFDAFGAFVKDFIRSEIFPRISHLVPSSTRQGAEAFLRMLQSHREPFEYDLTSMKRLEDVIADFINGKKTFADLVGRAIVAPQTQVVSTPDVRAASSILPDVLANQRTLAQDTREGEQFVPKSAIERYDVVTDAKVLFLEQGDELFGYKAWLRLSGRAYREKSEFFKKPHTTEIVWGGQRVMYIFSIDSGSAGFYYDVQLNELLTTPTGGKKFETMTLSLKDSVFVPIPELLYNSFVPHEGQKKRFDVRFDILIVD